jgi:hypothetical protein
MDKRPEYATLKIPIFFKDDRCKSVKSEYDVVFLEGEQSVPFFYKETVTREGYQELIMNFTSYFGSREKKVWLQEDFSRTRPANSQMLKIGEIFYDSIISRNCGLLTSESHTAVSVAFWGQELKTYTCQTRSTHQNN